MNCSYANRKNSTDVLIWVDLARIQKPALRTIKKQFSQKFEMFQSRAAQCNLIKKFSIVSPPIFQKVSDMSKKIK